MSNRVVVTGAFSYIGAAIAAELLRRGVCVHTLTNRQPPYGQTAISAAPLRFQTDHLVRELSGADALVNTYWVRLPHSGVTFHTAVQNSSTLIEAARRAGVRRVIQLSVSNAQAAGNLGYYAGKAEVEAAVRMSGLSYVVVRPTVIVGPQDVLTNNIAWLLRHCPVFLLPGGGTYCLQPVTLRDTARIVADVLFEQGNLVIDAAGPEVFSFGDYVRLLARACGVRRLVMGVPPSWAMAAAAIAGFLLHDIILAREELLALRQELLVSHTPPLGRESVAQWLMAHGAELGRVYANDLERHFGARKSQAILSPNLLSNG